VKIENPSEFPAVNWKVCKSAIALYCLNVNVNKRECVTKVLINSIIRTRTRHSRNAQHLRSNNIIINTNSTSIQFLFVYLQT
jgi:hypothetical protein